MAITSTPMHRSPGAAPEAAGKLRGCGGSQQPPAGEARQHGETNGETVKH